MSKTVIDEKAWERLEKSMAKPNQKAPDALKELMRHDGNSQKLWDRVFVGQQRQECLRDAISTDPLGRPAVSGIACPCPKCSAR